MHVFCGDSNIRQFFINPPIGVHYSVLTFSGATIKGLTNRTSDIGHGHAILNLHTTFNVKHMVLLFGAVDIDFSYIYKLSKGENIRFLDYSIEVIDSYIKFIKSIDLSAVDNLHILGVQLSPLNDNVFPKVLSVQCGVPIEVTKNIIREMDQKIRTSNTLIFNGFLENKIKELNNTKIKFHRIDTEMLDNNTGMVKSEFVNNEDHHPTLSKTLGLWKIKLKPYIRGF
jgi:hypothetical protein